MISYHVWEPETRASSLLAHTHNKTHDSYLNTATHTFSISWCLRIARGSLLCHLDKQDRYRVCAIILLTDSASIETCWHFDIVFWHLFGLTFCVLRSIVYRVLCYKATEKSCGNSSHIYLHLNKTLHQFYTTFWSNVNILFSTNICGVFILKWFILNNIYPWILAQTAWESLHANLTWMFTLDFHIQIKEAGFLIYMTFIFFWFLQKHGKTTLFKCLLTLTMQQNKYHRDLGTISSYLYNKTLP